MAKEVVWSLRAQKERKDILEYWRLRNKSNTYSKKLNQLFKESVKIIADFPQIGKPTEDINTRIKIVRDYLIIYEETESQIHILTIWDTRQDPEKLKNILG
jgi:addiction module RelE/StbE family toxin